MATNESDEVVWRQCKNSSVLFLSCSGQRVSCLFQEKNRRPFFKMSGDFGAYQRIQINDRIDAALFNGGLPSYWSGLFLRADLIAAIAA